MVPENQPSFETLASLCTRQQELYCPNILSYSYRRSSPIPLWKSLLPQTIILFFLKAPFLGEQFQQKYLELSCFMIFTVRARRALCQRKQPSHLKMKRWSPCLFQGHREEPGRELHLGSWLLQRCLQLHQSWFWYMQKHNRNLSKFFLPLGGRFFFYCYFTARGKKYIFTRQTWLQSRSPSTLWLFKASHANSPPCEW